MLFLLNNIRIILILYIILLGRNKGDVFMGARVFGTFGVRGVRGVRGVLGERGVWSAAEISCVASATEGRRFVNSSLRTFIIKGFSLKWAYALIFSRYASRASSATPVRRIRFEKFLGNSFLRIT